MFQYLNHQFWSFGLDHLESAGDILADKRGPRRLVLGHFHLPGKMVDIQKCTHQVWIAVAVSIVMGYLAIVIWWRGLV